jgi:hypothetical protein
MTRKIILSLVISCLGSGLSYGDTGNSGWAIFNKIQSSEFKTIASVSPADGDLSGIFYNPAVSGVNRDRQIFAMSELGQIGGNLIGLVYSEPVLGGVLSAGGVYYDAGTMDLNWMEGDVLNTESVDSERDILGELSYARKLNDRLFGGISAKVVTSKLIERDSATAVAGDIGCLYYPAKRLVISAALQNIGFATKYSVDQTPLPASGYLGLGYNYSINKIRLLPAGDIAYNIKDKTMIYGAGLEVGYEFVSMNFGYDFNMSDSNLHFGLKVAYDGITFGYAFIPAKYLDSTHLLSIGYKFGGSSASHQSF